MGMSSASSSDTTAPRQWHTTVEREGLRADACLSELSGLSKSKVKEVMSKGAAWITRGRRTQRLRRASRLLSPGDELHLYVNPSVLAATVTTPTLIADRGGYSVWDKPAGMLSPLACAQARYEDVAIVQNFFSNADGVPLAADYDGATFLEMGGYDGALASLTLTLTLSLRPPEPQP